MWTLVLSLGAASTWGVADFVGAIRARNYSALLVAVYSEIVGLVPVLVALYFVQEAFPGWSLLPWMIVAGVAGSVGHVVFFTALARGPIGVIAPIFACSSAGPAVIAVTMLGERPSIMQLGGIALAIAGVVLVSRHAGEGDIKHGKYGAVPIALIGVAILTVFYIAMDQISQDSPLWGVTMQRTFGLPLLLIGLAIGLRRGTTTAPRGSFMAIAPVGLMDTAAFVAFAYATSLGNLSVAVVLSSLYPVVTILLARIKLDERLSGVQRVGAGLALLGVVAIVAG
ncbi:MAG: DMT family transporter [Thermoleophilia bacterium]